jgi:hypothetical protein
VQDVIYILKGLFKHGGKFYYFSLLRPTEGLIGNEININYIRSQSVANREAKFINDDLFNAYLPNSPDNQSNESGFLFPTVPPVPHFYLRA